MINGLAYLTYRVLTGRLRERLLPIRWPDIVDTDRDTLRLRIAHEDLTTYNAMQKTLYIVAISAGALQVVTGLAIWNPVQFGGLVDLFGGFETDRVVHFSGIVVLVSFLLVHVALAVLVPRTLWAMLTGGPRLPKLDRAGPVVTSPFRPVTLPDAAVLDGRCPLIRSLPRRSAPRRVVPVVVGTVDRL